MVHGHGHWRGRDVVAAFVIGNLFILVLFARDIVRFDHGLVANNAFWGRDFINVWSAGRLLIEGRLTILYDLPAYHAWQVAHFGAIGQHNFSYPPLVLPLMLPFGALPYAVALAVWTLAGAALFLHAARPWWRAGTGLPLWLVLITPAALVNVWAGHYGFLIGALVLHGWRALERGHARWAGLFFGLLAIKPHLAVVIPLILLVRRDWRTIAVAAATVGALVALSVLLFPPALWQQYLGATAGLQASLIDAGGNFCRYMSTSLATGLIALSVPKSLALMCQAALGIVAAAAVVQAARACSLRTTALMAATATFLILPYAFNYDLTVVALAAVLLLARGNLTGVEQRLALGGFVAPQVGMTLSGFGVPGIPMLLLGLFTVQCRLAWKEASAAASRNTPGAPLIGTSQAGRLPAASNAAMSSG
jgi:hypothetical protein